MPDNNVKLRVELEGASFTLEELNKIRRAIPGLASASKELAALQSQLGAGGVETTKFVSGVTPRNLKQYSINADLINRQMRILEAGNRPNATEYKRAWESMVPPTIKRFDWKTAMIGAAIAPFSPWVGARALTASGAFGGGATTGGGGIGNALWGPGGFKHFLIEFALITAVTRSLRLAFSELKDAVERGAKLYQQAASTARPIAKLFQAQQAFSSIGLAPETANRLLVQAQMRMRGGWAMSGDQGYGMMMRGAMSVGDIETMQQLVNMSKEFKQAWDDARGDSFIMSQIAGVLKDMFMDIASVLREFRTTFAEVATVFGPEIKMILNITKAWLQQINMTLLALIYLRYGKEGMLSALGQQPDNTRLSNGQYAPQGSMFEKLGFVISPFNTTNEYLKQIEINTRGLRNKNAEAGVSYSFAAPLNLP